MRFCDLQDVASVDTRSGMLYEPFAIVARHPVSTAELIQGHAASHVHLLDAYHAPRPPWGSMQETIPSMRCRKGRRRRRRHASSAFSCSSTCTRSSGACTRSAPTWATLT